MPDISICMGSSCYSRGNDTIRRVVEAYLKRNGLEDTVDFRGTLCTGRCGEGPNIIINGVLYQKIEEGVLLDILEKNFGKKA